MILETWLELNLHVSRHQMTKKKKYSCLNREWDWKQLIRAKDTLLRRWEKRETCYKSSYSIVLETFFFHIQSEDFKLLQKNQKSYFMEAADNGVLDGLRSAPSPWFIKFELIFDFFRFFPSFHLVREVVCALVCYFLHE